MRRRSRSSLAIAVTCLAVTCLGAGLLPMRPAGAIVGGDEADPDEWPWQVSIQVDGSQWCGGSLLSYDIVLTAAHCTDGMRAAEFEVVAGTVDIGDGSNGQRRQVDAIRQHEDYDPIEIRNDISLLVLESAFDPSDHVAPVSIPDPATERRLTEGGSPAFVTGFGATSEDSPPSDVLLEADVEIIDDQRCFTEYGQDGSEVFTDTEVCAGRERGHVGSCFGDSGGPLVVPSGSPDEWLLVGIVSWGAGCARAFRPTVYTEVSSYLDWLVDNGVAGVDGERFDFEQPIRVPAVGTRGKAGPYPAVLDVDGFDGDVHEVAVELRGIEHGRAEDLDIWLQAPDGTVVTLLSDSGGRERLTDRTLVIVAGGPEAGDGPLPIQLGPADREPDTQRSGRPSAPDLGPLAGIDPNGEWRLLVADDEDGSTGSIAGWSLILA